MEFVVHSFIGTAESIKPDNLCSTTLLLGGNHSINVVLLYFRVIADWR